MNSLKAEMNIRHKPRFIVIAVITTVMFIIITLINISELLQKMKVAESSLQLVMDCKKLERQIDELNLSDVYALDEEVPLTEMNQIIEEAVKYHNVPIQAIGKITYEGTQSHKDTDYQISNVKFNIHSITIEKLVKILINLLKRCTFINIQDVHLKALKDNTQEGWSAVISLSYFIYSPTD